MRDLPDIYFLPQWAELYQERENGKAEIFEFEHIYGYIHYQFIKRAIPIELHNEVYYDMVTPYGFSGPIILDCHPAKRNELVELFIKAFDHYCMQNNIISEYIRFNPWLKNHLDFASYYDMKYNDVTYYTDLTNGDFLLNEFDSHKRRSIKNAIKAGVQIEFDYKGESVSEFNRIYQMTAKKNGISDNYMFSDDFLKKTFHLLNNHQFFTKAVFEGKCISVELNIHYGDYIHGHLSANDPDYYYLGTSSLMYYAAAKWGAENGKKQYHYGGAHTTGLHNFKRGFTKNGLCDFYVGKKIHNHEIYRALTDIKIKEQGIKDASFFPLYRG